MATAAGISITALDLAQQAITTTDANQSLVSCGADVWSVLVWVSDAAGSGDGRVVTVGAAQGAAENTAAQIVRAGGSLVVTPNMVGKSPFGPWSFGVCREAAVDATFLLTPQRT